MSLLVSCWGYQKEPSVRPGLPCQTLMTTRHWLYWLQLKQKRTAFFYADTHTDVQPQLLNVGVEFVTILKPNSGDKLFKCLTGNRVS
jgi:hypothetical protein